MRNAINYTNVTATRGHNNCELYIAIAALLVVGRGLLSEILVMANDGQKLTKKLIANSLIYFFN